VMGSIALKTVLLLCALCAQAQPRPVLLTLESSPDPNTDVLFNMQTRRMEELVYLALMAERVLVEPQYSFGARNWTWFESSNNNQQAKNEVIHEGVLGLVQEPLSSFFLLDPLQKLLGSNIEPLGGFHSRAGGRVDRLLRFQGPGLPACDRQAASVTSYGYKFSVSAVECLSPWQFSSIDDFLNLLVEGEIVAIQFMPAKFVELRFPSWRQSDVRWDIRKAFSWAKDLVRRAEDFIAAHFGGLNPSNGLGQYLAIHWRRGDRAYRQEMHIHGHVDVALTAPERMVGFVQDVIAGFDLSGIFLATNCGNEQDMMFVEESLGSKRFPSSNRWDESAREAVVEQIIMSRAAVIVVPPGVGNPPNVNDTSNFSLFVIEQRMIDASLLNVTPPPPFFLCCGTSPVLSIWRPAGGDALLDVVEVQVWGAFLPWGMQASILISAGRQLVVEAPLSSSGTVRVFGLKPGQYKMEAILAETGESLEEQEGRRGEEEEEGTSSMVLDSVSFSVTGAPSSSSLAVEVDGRMMVESFDMWAALSRSSFSDGSETSHVNSEGTRISVRWETATSLELSSCVKLCDVDLSCRAVLLLEERGGKCGRVSALEGALSLQDLFVPPSSPEESRPPLTVKAAVKMEEGRRIIGKGSSGCLPLHFVCMRG